MVKYFFFVCNSSEGVLTVGAILDGIMGDLACTYGGESLSHIIPEDSDPTKAILRKS